MGALRRFFQSPPLGAGSELRGCSDLPHYAGSGSEGTRFAKALESMVGARVNASHWQASPLGVTAAVTSLLSTPSMITVTGTSQPIGVSAPRVPFT